MKTINYPTFQSETQLQELAANGYVYALQLCNYSDTVNKLSTFKSLSDCRAHYKANKNRYEMFRFDRFENGQWKEITSGWIR